MSPGIGAPNRGSRIKEDSIVLNRQLGSWELAKCCCLLSLLSGKKAICQTIVEGKLFLIHPLASERPSWCSRKPSCLGHSRKWSVCLKQRLATVYIKPWDVIPSWDRELDADMTCNQRWSFLEEKKTNAMAAHKFTFHGMEHSNCICYQIIVERRPLYSDSPDRPWFYAAFSRNVWLSAASV